LDLEVSFNGRGWAIYDPGMVLVAGNATSIKYYTAGNWQLQLPGDPQR
jgi:hypothetical protein